MSSKKSPKSETVTEKILRECHEIYTDSENGLCGISRSMGKDLLAPRKKITVMLIGNHSAGKSTFINWYIEEHIQKTGVAIETQGFTLVSSGKRRETLSGNATIHLYPEYKPLLQIDGMMNYLQTEITTSKQKQTALVHFCDTPGLVDGDMKYPFDVNDAILWMANMVDLVLVFFDPIGQALCKRTLDVVEALSYKHGEKIRYFLSKADEAGEEGDRQRVLMQIVQELCRRPNLNQTCFDMPTIYVDEKSRGDKRCNNQIDIVCTEIQKTINMTVQNSLNRLEADCERIAHQVEETLSEDDHNRTYNMKASLRFLFYLVFIFSLPTMMLTNTIKSLFCDSDGFSFCGYLKFAERDPFMKLIHIFPSDYQQHVILSLILLWVVVILLAKYSTRSRRVMTRREKKSLSAKAKYVSSTILPQKEQLYKEYLAESIAEDF